MIFTDFVQLTMSFYVAFCSSGSNLIFIAIYVSCMFIDSSILYISILCCLLA